MKNKPWEIEEWGVKDDNGKFVVNTLTLDNRKYPPGTKEKNVFPLLTMKVSARYSLDELKAYLVQIRDALNAAGIVEGTIEDPDQPK